MVNCSSGTQRAHRGLMQPWAAMGLARGESCQAASRSVPLLSVTTTRKIGAATRAATNAHSCRAAARSGPPDASGRVRVRVRVNPNPLAVPVQVAAAR